MEEMEFLNLCLRLFLRAQAILPLRRAAPASQEPIARDQVRPCAGEKGTDTSQASDSTVFCSQTARRHNTRK